LVHNQTFSGHRNSTFEARSAGRLALSSTDHNFVN